MQLRLALNSLESSSLSPLSAGSSNHLEMMFDIEKAPLPLIKKKFFPLRNKSLVKFNFVSFQKANYKHVAQTVWDRLL